MADPKPKIYQLDACSLFAPVEGNKRANLSWSYRDQYPRLTVFTRTESDNDGKGVLTAAFDLEHFTIFLNALERVARTEGEQRGTAAVKHWPRDGQGKINGDREVTCEVFYGKNADGVVWISLVQKDRPKIVFKIELSEYHEYKNSKGQVLTPAEGSVARTIAMCAILKEAFIRQLTTFRDTSIPRENKGPYSQRGGQPQAGSRAAAYAAPSSSAEFEESDIPL